MRNKFDLFTEQVKANVDVLVISKTKLASSFPECKFKIPGFSIPFRYRPVQSIMVFVRDDIPSKLFLLEAAPIEGLYIELREKVVFNYSDNPNKDNIWAYFKPFEGAKEKLRLINIRI